MGASLLPPRQPARAGKTSARASARTRRPTRGGPLGFPAARLVGTLDARPPGGAELGCMVLSSSGRLSARRDGDVAHVRGRVEHDPRGLAVVVLRPRVELAP